MHLKPIRPLVTLARAVLPVALLTGHRGKMLLEEMLEFTQERVSEAVSHLLRRCFRDFNDMRSLEQRKIVRSDIP